MKTAVILGVGGLGCPAALALAESGFPVRLLLVDGDRVEKSNLARQILFSDADVGQPKAEVAARRLSRLSGDMMSGASRDSCPPSVLTCASRDSCPPSVFEPRVMRFEPATAEELLAGCDVLLDGTDNFDTRFHANDEAVRRRIPLVHGAALGWTGQLATILPGRTACLRCLFEGPPENLPTCAEAGVLAPLCGVVGAAMAQAAIAVLSGKPDAGVLRRWDALRGTERPLPLKRDPSCAACAGVAS